jgi:mannose-1-phosphate guanylyltransferase
MEENNLCALILAGGVGSRFWPESTPQMPKQFLNLVDNNRTMLQLTVDRITDYIPLERIFILVAPNHKEIVLEQIKGINDKNIIIQPEVMNTAPCILMSSLYIKDLYGNSNLIVMPSDHLIKKEDLFLETIKAANSFNINLPSGIITIGITPNRPETGYGYIKLSNKIIKSSNKDVIKIEKFVEKPCFKKALEYLENGNYLWNSGMFLFNIDYVLDVFKKNLPKTYKILSNLPNANDSNYLQELINNYGKCEAISFDVAVMEHTNNNFVIPSNFIWDDIGTWRSLERYNEKDNNNNIVMGNVKCIDAKNNTIYAGKKPIALLGLDDIFCVDTDDILIIGKKELLDNLHKYKDIICNQFENKEDNINNGSDIQQEK